MEEKKRELTAEKKEESNYYNIKKMIYYDLPVLVTEIIHAAFLNCQPGGSVVSPEDMKFIIPFIEELKKTFETAIEGQTRQIENMTKINE